MTDDIFVPSFGNKPSILIGRDAYINEFKNCLSTKPGSRERSIILLGQRGYGKTVMLLELMDIASEMGYVVAAPTVTSSLMLTRIIEKLEDTLSSKAKPIGGNIDILGFGVGVQFQGNADKSFGYKLTQICREYNKKKKGVLILIDEVQANSNELKQLIITYQELVGEGIDIALCMAGLPGAVSATLNNHVLTFLNRSTKIDLAPLKLIDVSTYYEQQFKTLKINITNDKCKELAEETEGSPYLMQLLGHYITLKCNDNGTIIKSAIDEAIKSAKEDYIRDICQTIINTLSDKDIEFLKAMNADETKISDIIDRMGVSNAYAQLYKKRLIDSGVIEQVKRGTVTFAVAYLYDYLNEYL